jgi:hypothetical protein
MPGHTEGQEVSKPRCEEIGVRGTRCTLPEGHYEDCMFAFDELGWSDQVARIKQKMQDRDKPTYTDQNGNEVPLCMICWYWRATDGDMCEMCAADLSRHT